MATLKEAVESGRRWRYCYDKNGDCTAWFGPAYCRAENENPVFTVSQALSSDFEIESEPEKPREWTVCNHPGVRCNMPDLEITRQDSVRLLHFRVHDADACDRLRGK